MSSNQVVHQSSSSSSNGQHSGSNTNTSGHQQQQQQQQQGSNSDNHNNEDQGSSSGQSSNSQDPQFPSLQKAAQLLSSRSNIDARIEQATELSEVLNCEGRIHTVHLIGPT